MNNIENLNNEIDSYLKDGQYQTAKKELLRYIDIIPNSVDLLSRLGLSYEKLNEFDNALLCHQKVAELKPDDPDALCNVAITKLKLGRRSEARFDFDQILTTFPNHYNTLNQIGLMISDLGDLEEAIGFFKKAISIDDNLSYAHVNLANVYKIQGLFGKAIHHLEQSLQIPPVTAVTYNNLANIYLQSCFHEKACETYQKAISIDPNLLYAQENYLLSLHYSDNVSKEDIFRLHLEWGKNFESQFKQYTTYTNSRIQDRRLRVGYVSGDFRQHAVGLFIISVIKNHRRLHIEPYLYYSRNVFDSLSMKFMEMVPTGWRDISSLSDDQAAELIRNEKIDILVDLSGHTTDSRLGVFARKPAPIQITYLGYPDTTGLTTIDYRLTDSYADPDESNDFYTETLIRIPDCFLCAEYIIENTIPIKSKKEDSATIVLGSFNMSSKINSASIRIWSRILKQIPNSTLLLKSNAFSDNDVSNHIRDLFANNGIAEDRLQIRGYTKTYREHLDLYNTVDIALDPYPYNGTTTTIEALAMGCPVFTLVGTRHSARVGHSILRNCGCEDFISWNEDDYISKVVALSQSPSLLREIKDKLRHKLQQSVLADAAGFVEKIEYSYRTVWKEWCQKNTPQNVVSILLPHNISICIPEAPDTLTPYVLHEQGEWYEKKDLYFLNSYLENGDCTIDIGANYGMYTLNMAKNVGDHGKVIATEPSSNAVSYLKLSLQNNQFKNVVVFEAALSNTKTAAKLSIDPETECNKISSEETICDIYEQICLLTLDSLIESTSMNNLSFIRINAQGLEGELLAGADKVLNEESPLILYKLDQGQNRSFQFQKQIEEYGYTSYYLIPGLNILAPLENMARVDAMCTNLYFCKPELAETLEHKSLLCRQQVTDVKKIPESVALTQYFDDKPCYPTLRLLWQSNSSGVNTVNYDYLDILTRYVMSQDRNLPAPERVGLLCTAFSSLKDISESEPTIPRLLTLIRLASELGERTYAVNVLKIVLDTFSSDEQFVINEEHLAVSKRFEQIEPGEMIGEWYLSSVLELLISSEFHTSYYDPQLTHLQYLELLDNLGFQLPDMQQRHQAIISYLKAARNHTMEQQ